MSFYAIVAIDITDREGYAEYEHLAGQILVNNPQIEVLAVDDNPRLLEGRLPGERIVLLKCNDEAELTRWYKGHEYQNTMKIRQRTADTAFFLTVEGGHA